MYVGLIGISILLATTYFQTDKHVTILNVLSSLGGFLGGVASILAAIVAFLGVNTWKKQLKHGKHISLIWSCMESLRTFQSEVMDWYVEAYAHCIRSKESSDFLDLKKKRLEVTLDTLSANFSALDKIVVKNQWEWANYAGTLKGSVVSTERLFREYREEPYDEPTLNQALSEIYTSRKSIITVIENELDKLESHYQ